MATTQAPGTGFGPVRGRPGRQAMIVAAAALAVALAVAGITVLFGVWDVVDDGVQASPVPSPTHAGPSAPSPQHAGLRAGVGSPEDLPALLPAARTSLAGTRVRLGDITYGVLRRTPHRTWEVRVWWNGRLQRVAMRGRVRPGASATAQAPASWVSGQGLLYTRVPTGSPHRFRVYAWDPRGGTAYTPPRLVATDLGPVCFNASFTAFGDCGTDATRPLGR
jgi:hypothetical protein